MQIHAFSFLNKLHNAVLVYRAHFNGAVPRFAFVSIKESHVLHHKPTRSRNDRRVMGQAEIEHSHAQVEVSLGQDKDEHVVRAAKRSANLQYRCLVAKNMYVQ